MTALDLPLAGDRAGSPFAELRRRQPALTAVGLAFLMLSAIAASLSVVDGRLLEGVSVWAKPAKFLLSTGVLTLTSAWFFGYVRPERRNARPLKVSVFALIGFGAFEMGYIALQAAQGARSHFNYDDMVHGVIYGMMGAAAVGMLATKLVLAREIALRPVPALDPNMRRAVVTGLVLTAVLGTLSGAAMSLNSAHNVGAVGGAAPLFGWNRAGGDLRVAHFFGMHGEQIVPMAAAIAGLWLGRGAVRRLTYATAGAIVATTVFVFAQALMGRPFLG